jgi:sugar O-acyltransferase (sialic acid O-acetyltransferase NeuD family)
MSLQPLILLGHGGFGREVAAWIKVRGLPFRVEGFLDDTQDGPGLLGAIVGHVPQQAQQALYLACLGDGWHRRRLRLDLETRGAHFATIVFPEVTSASELSATRNSLFMGACSISHNVAMGNDVLVQGFAAIGHDVDVGDGCTINNHAFVGGGARLGQCCTVHPHAVVLPNVRIGEAAVVGAGSVVIKDVEPHATVFGVPAKVISRANPRY